MLNEVLKFNEHHKSAEKIAKKYFATTESERSWSGAVYKSDGAGAESERLSFIDAGTGAELERNFLVWSGVGAERFKTHWSWS